MTSAACWDGDDGSNVVSLKSTCTFPVYQDPAMLSGISTKKLTDGVMVNFANRDLQLRNLWMNAPVPVDRVQLQQLENLSPRLLLYAYHLN